MNRILQVLVFAFDVNLIVNIIRITEREEGDIGLVVNIRDIKHMKGFQWTWQQMST